MIDPAAWHRDGYAIVRGFFTADEVAAIGAEIDRVHAEGIAHGRSFRHGNLFYKIAEGDSGPLVQMVQWPSYHWPALDAVRLDPRFAALLAPLIGARRQADHQPAPLEGAGRGGRFRLAPGFALPPAGALLPQSRHLLRPDRPRDRSAQARIRRHVAGAAQPSPRRSRPRHDHRRARQCRCRTRRSKRSGLSAADAIQLDLDPGDLALWNPYLVHGSGPNRSDHQRRFYINGYVRAEDCDRGEWAFRDGRPVPLGPEPALVHYEELRERGEPHYV